ncbi:MAG: VOC family protein [Janthinobacterium lividum]
MRLNHLGLGLSDVPATAAMFKKYFGFVQAPGPPNNAKMAFLTDDAGSLITLFKVEDVVYPDIFHIGFMLGKVAQVQALHDQLTADGFNPEAMRNEHGCITFYFQAPGGVTVEVNSLAEGGLTELQQQINPN